MTAPIDLPGAQDTGSADSSPLGSPLVSSTSPPCIPHLPPSPGTAPPPTASILRNPLQPPPSAAAATLAQPQPRAGPSSLLLPNPFKRSDQAQSQPQRKRTPSFTVEVYSPPPPAHFYQHAADQSDGSAPGTPSYSASPPRIALPPPGMRSRSVSPAPSPAPRSPASPSSPGSSAGTLHSPGAGGGAAAGSTTTLSSTGSAGQSVKFAPLPPGRKAHRSNSLSIGVASRAKMIQSQGGAPNVRGARYAGPLQWYEGGPLPEDVYTWKDVQRGVTKLFKRVKGSSASSTVSEPGDAGDRERGRSASVSSAATTSSSGSADEARRMEREAKGKSREIEHIEEAEEEDVEAARPVLDEREDVPATVADEDDGDGGPTFDDEEDDDDDGTSASEVTAPRTPPESDLRDGDLEIERRRVRKGKGVDDAEHRGVRVASA
ncbi:hypothetical protein JCM10450v2_002036 [Rhodotorula kratochvilovae]